MSVTRYLRILGELRSAFLVGFGSAIDTNGRATAARLRTITGVPRHDNDRAAFAADGQAIAGDWQRAMKSTALHD